MLALHCHRQDTVVLYTGLAFACDCDNLCIALVYTFSFLCALCHYDSLTICLYDMGVPDRLCLTVCHNITPT